MWKTARKLALGIALIGLASAILLFSGGARRTSSGKRLPRVAVLQLASQKIIDEGVQGMIDALAEAGYVDGRTIELRRFNAQNDLPTATAIAKEAADSGYDLVLTATTPMLQAMAKANAAGKTVHVFGLVSDPFASGVGLDRAHPAQHPPQLVGIGTRPPVADTLRLAKRIFPALKTVGIVWNPAEFNSELSTRDARAIAPELGFTLLEATVENSSGVSEAAASLVSRGVQALFVGGDVTVNVAIDSVITAARQAHIPVFTCTPGNSARGTLFDVGADYHEVGRLTGQLAAQILQGVDPRSVPVREIIPKQLVVNTAALASLRDPWRFPADVLAGAVNTKPAAASGGSAGPAATAKPPGPPLSKTWNLYLIEYNDVVDVKDSEEGVLAGLRENGLIEGRDYRTKILNAQGDMATVSALVDSAVSSGADLLITFSTPTLQAAMQRAQGRPVVFTYVANALTAGAGRSLNDHLPNVTGVSTLAAYTEMMEIFRQYFPAIHTVGTLHVPAEVNMVYHHALFLTEAKKAGLKVVTIPVSTTTEVADAALALTQRGVDAIVQIPGNLTASAFSSISQAALRARLPVFAFQKVQAQQGAIVVTSREFRDAGRLSAGLAARIMRGESPAAIPLMEYTVTTMYVNPGAARAIGFTLPPAVIRRADHIIEGANGNQ